MAEHEPTNGEIRVELRNIYSLLEVMSKTMVTKELFDAKFDLNLERIRRLEDDQRKWMDDSGRVHVQLEADSKSRHAESLANADALEVRMGTRVEKVETKFDDADKDIKAAGRSKYNAWLAAGLAIAGSVLVKLFFPSG